MGEGSSVKIRLPEEHVLVYKHPGGDIARSRFIKLKLPYRDLEELLRGRRKARSLELLVSHADKVFQVVDELLKLLGPG